MPFVNISRPTHSSGGGSAGPEGPPGPEGPAADLSAYAETAYVDTQDEGLQVQIDALEKAVAELKEEPPDTADAVWPGPIEVPDGL